MISICACVKNEGLNLEEWLNYHMSIGVEKFYIYDNESTDNTKKILFRYPNVKYFHITGSPIQMKVYCHCLKFVEDDWVGFIDVDEFVVPVEKPFPEVLKDYDDYAGLAINWVIYGSSGHKVRPKGNVKDNYLYRSEYTFDINNHVKCFVKPKLISHPVNPHSFQCKENQIVNENFTPINGSFSPFSGNKIRINHYYCKSNADYIMKIQRGRADIPLNTHCFDKFRLHDQNDVYDNILERR